jgi:hypothetical protein
VWICLQLLIAVDDDLKAVRTREAVFMMQRVSLSNLFGRGLLYRSINKPEFSRCSANVRNGVMWQKREESLENFSFSKECLDCYYKIELYREKGV